MADGGGPPGPILELMKSVSAELVEEGKAGKEDGGDADTRSVLDDAAAASAYDGPPGPILELMKSVLFGGAKGGGQGGQRGWGRRGYHVRARRRSRGLGLWRRKPAKAGSTVRGASHKL